MSLPALPLVVDPDAAPVDPRRDERTPAVRLVEYTAFPRAARDAAWRCAFTRDSSQGGWCIVATRPESPGALLRLVVLDVDGRPAQDAVARVVWCRANGDGRHRIGLESMAVNARAMRKVRRAEDDAARRPA